MESPYNGPRSMAMVAAPRWLWSVVVASEKKWREKEERERERKKSCPALDNPHYSIDSARQPFRFTFRAYCYADLGIFDRARKRSAGRGEHQSNGKTFPRESFCEFCNF